MLSDVCFKLAISQAGLDCGLTGVVSRDPTFSFKSTASFLIIRSSSCKELDRSS